MPKITVVVPHALGQETAASRLRDFTARLKEEHEKEVSEVSEEWSDNSLSFGFKTFGMRFHGTGQVSGAEARLNVDVPLAALMFKGKIESEIRQTLTRVLQT